MYKYEQDSDKIKMATSHLKFKYKNWKGETSIRNVIPKEIWYGDSKFHKGSQWFMKAYDVDKKSERNFAIIDIIEYIKVEEI